MKKQYNLITSILTSLVDGIKFTKDDTISLDADVNFVYKDVDIKYNFTHSFDTDPDESNLIIQEKKDLMTQLLVDSILQNLADVEKNISESNGQQFTPHNYLDELGKQDAELIYYMDKSILELFAAKNHLQSSVIRNDKLLSSLYHEFKLKDTLSFFKSSHPLAEYIQEKEVK